MFLDRSNQVLQVEERVRPFHISMVLLKANSILELPVHAVFRTGTRVDDQLEVRPAK